MRESFASGAVPGPKTPGRCTTPSLPKHCPEPCAFRRATPPAWKRKHRGASAHLLKLASVRKVVRIKVTEAHTIQPDRAHAQPRSTPTLSAKKSRRSPQGRGAASPLLRSFSSSRTPFCAANRWLRIPVTDRPWPEQPAPSFNDRVAGSGKQCRSGTMRRIGAESPKGKMLHNDSVPGPGVTLFLGLGSAAIRGRRFSPGP